ncbi:hypothetical protein Tco_0517649 [Tanacetum coccineum]
MYTSSWRSPWRKALFMSSCLMNHPFETATARRVLTVTILATGEKIYQWKLCENPEALCGSGGGIGGEGDDVEEDGDVFGVGDDCDVSGAGDDCDVSGAGDDDGGVVGCELGGGCGCKMKRENVLIKCDMPAGKNFSGEWVTE